MIIDSHCHLNLPKLKERMDEVVASATAAGVSYMQTICTDLEEYPEIISITEKYPQVFGSVGVHPSDVEKGQRATIETLTLYGAHPKIIGFGETGLDYYYDNAPRNKQVDSFEQHIGAAQILPLPVIIHSRMAEDETESMVRSHMKTKEFKGLIHCFTANLDFARKILDAGLYISIAGIVTFKNAEELQEVARFVPIDRLLVETDAPFLAPVPMRGKTNEPAYVVHVLKCIAELKGLDYNELARITTDNFMTLFDKAARYIHGS